MQTYLVGGFVRDKLLGISSKDRDWLVVGSTPTEMTDLGFRQVGADFPVFLHPDTQEEYALARCERKSGTGYQGFVCDFGPEVTVEQDLERRDLTINAMALTDAGALIDPFNGKTDLEQKLLRHVSDAFVEDPLRVLRIARFLARFDSLGFTVAKSTKDLCVRIADSGELETLTPERVWQETARALSEPSPHQYFQFLRDTGALKSIFPEIDALFGVPQPEQHHPEIDCGIHAILSLQAASLMTEDIGVRFAAFSHDLGKALTPKENLPRHIGHELKGVKPAKTMAKRLKIPSAIRDLCVLTNQFHTHIHRAFELRSETILKVIKQCDGIRRPERIHQLCLAAKADSRGRTGLKSEPYRQADFFMDALKSLKNVDIQTIVKSGLEGKELGDAIDDARVREIQQFKDVNLAQYTQTF